MSELKRYDVEVNGPCSQDFVVVECGDGDWVKAEEALARIAELEATLAHVRAVCEIEVEEDGMRGAGWYTVPVDAVREALGEGVERG